MQAINAVYLKTTARLRVNNIFSETIVLGKGTRKGCPLLPLLFAFAIEPLASLIQVHEKIKGIKNCDIEKKIGLYADDIVMYISNFKTFLKYTLNTFKEFANVPDLKMNPNESDLYPIYLPAELRKILIPLDGRRLHGSTWI